MSSEHPYSLAVERDGVVYVSGAAGVDKDGKPVHDRRGALDAALNQVSDRLENLGLSLANVTKANYFVTDIKMRDDANRQFEERFQEPRPARSIVGVSELPYGAWAVIEAVAHR
jgi:2-iminobutanoate/2-iminopropanoate deaminase